ncbi:SDR family NAD(P)-dependent oxidoreductase [Nonomuraea sp. NPDC050383]|uniref:SDR family NAD(P)-dependent oxidoreductase n=1 Tax=Nonomuraea sp. NPDC050383 TaxID=3364362 RepID=UPI00378BE196
MVRKSPVSADLSTAAGVTTLIDGALAELSGIDLLVNNAGAGDAIQPVGFLDTDDEQWTAALRMAALHEKGRERPGTASSRC